jgi:cytochrome b561
MGATTKSAKTPVRYDLYTIVLHWLMAILVLLAWGIGEVVSYLPAGLARGNTRSVHIIVGVAIAILLVVRLTHHATGSRSLPLPGIFNPLGKGVHYALYILLAGQVLLGLALAWLRGDSLFGVVWLPGSPDTNLMGLVEEFHDSAGLLIIILAGVHTVAALIHHFVLRDNVMRRMLP